MKYILIDTNSWKHLLENDPKSEISGALVHWLNENAITILMPEVIKDKEWPRMQEKHLREVKKAHKLTVDQVDMTKSPLSGAVSHAYAAVLRKIAEVNKIIDAGKYIKFSQKVSNLVMRRYNEGQPPFHTKENSNDDGLIYYSSIEYLQLKGIAEFIFISNDKKGFSDETDPDKLHPKLEISGLKIEFHRNIHKAVHELKAVLPKLESIIQENDIDYVSEFSVLESKPKHILDQLHAALDQYSDQLRFIPTDILRRLFPIKAKNKKYPYTEYSSYSLGTNNKQLYELISSIELKPHNKFVFTNKELVKGVTHLKKKLFEVYRRLNDNNVTGIFLIGSHAKEIDIELNDSRKCNCTRCSAYRLDFSRSLSVLENKPSEDVLETMKHAHVQFLFGNFSNALRLFSAAYEKSVQEEKSIRAFICFYNMKRIKNFINGYFQKVDDDIKKIIEKVEKNATIQEIYSYRDQSDFSVENINWLKENKFFNDPYFDVTQTVEKIRSHYYSQLTGGWSNNSNIRVLITKVVEYERFLHQNAIVFQASDIMEIFEPAMDGLFMAHSFNVQQDSRLVYFNDYLLLMMIKYVKSETIYRYFKRYHLKSLKYQRGEKKIWHLESIATQFFETYPDIIKAFNEKKEGEGYFFQHTLQRSFINLLTVCTLAETKKELPNQIIRAILKITKEEMLIRKTEHEYLGAFLIHKGKYLDKEILIEFTETAILNEQFHDEHIFDALHKLIKKHHRTCNISNPAILSAIEEFFMAKCPKCNEIHYQNSLMDLYYIVTPSFRPKIKSFLESVIQSEKQWNIFYMACMVDILDPKEQIHIFLPKFEPPPRELPKLPSMFHHRQEAVLFGLNELINLSLKFDLAIQDTLMKYKGLSDYYDFILDIDNFDNKKFKPEWVMEYRTSLFLEKIFGNEKIAAIMKKHLKVSKHPRMSEYYIEYAKSPNSK
jgi:hypothetical protein